MISWHFCLSLTGSYCTFRIIQRVNIAHKNIVYNNYYCYTVCDQDTVLFVIRLLTAERFCGDFHLYLRFKEMDLVILLHLSEQQLRHCSNRQIFVYTFCLINICLSLSDDANKIKTLNIERA